MNRHLHRVTILLCSLSLQVITAEAKDTDKDDKDLGIGTVASIEKDRITMHRSEGKGEDRTLRLTKDSKVQYVGFKGLGQSVKAPQPGYGIKARVAHDGTTINSAVLSPPVPHIIQIPGKEKLTPEELFKAADQNKNGRVDYVEYATWIFQSSKHLPDRWQKLDKNNDDVLDLAEFTESLDELEWWRTTRKTAEDWVREADKDKSGELNMEETKSVTGSAHGKFDKLFSKLDKDKSGGVSAAELQPFLDSALRGKKRDQPE